jgi:hypothetical protein
MAQEITFAYKSGLNLYAILRSAAGQYWHVINAAFEPFNGADWSVYAFTVAELGAGSGQYQADFPEAPAGTYAVDLYVRAGGGPAASDGPPVGGGAIEWDGLAELPLASVANAPALFGTVGPDPAPTATTVPILLPEALAATAAPAAFVGLRIVLMPGGAAGAPTYAPISSCVIESPTALILGLGAPLAAIPAPGDGVAISG